MNSKCLIFSSSQVLERVIELGFSVHSQSGNKHASLPSMVFPTDVPFAKEFARLC